MALIKANNVKKGMYILFRNEPHEITKAEFYAPGKGSAVERMKLKNLTSGNVVEFTYKSNEMVEELDISAKEMQFLYMEGEDAIFMDPRSYDQVTVPGKLLEGKEQYLLPELTMYVVFYDERIMGVRFPPKVTMLVTESHDAVAGNTVGGARKPVIIETGFTVMAPLFVKKGDKLIIDTDSGEYVSRAN